MAQKGASPRADTARKVGGKLVIGSGEEEGRTCAPFLFHSHHHSLSYVCHHFYVNHRPHPQGPANHNRPTLSHPLTHIHTQTHHSPYLIPPPPAGPSPGPARRTMDATPAPYGTTTRTPAPASASAGPVPTTMPAPAPTPPSNQSHPSSSSSAAAAAAAVAAAVASSATGAQSRPCDICRQRKTRCVREEGRDKCVMCSFHGQPCTYLRGPLPRKRRKATDPPEVRPQTNGSGNAAAAGPPPAPMPLDHQEEIT